MTVDLFIKSGPAACGIISFLILLTLNFKNKKENNLQDLFIVGIAGSSIPTGLLLVYSAFDFTVISKLGDAGVYMAFSGLALLYIFYKTFTEKA